MSIVLHLPLVADAIACELDFPATLRAVFLLVIVLLEFAHACFAHHMPAPNVNRIVRESQPHSACEVKVGLPSHRFGDEVHIKPRLLGLIMVEVMRIARSRSVGSHVDSKIKTRKINSD